MTNHKHILLGSLAALSLLIIGAGCSQTARVQESTQTTVDQNAIVQDGVVEADTASKNEDSKTEATASVKTETGIKIETPIDLTVKSDTSIEVKLQTFNLTGKNFAFNTAELKVKKGDRVKIIFKSESGFHDFVLDEFNARTKQLKDGEVDTVEFTADKAGTFEYYCSVGKHRQMGMVGKLIVE